MDALEALRIVSQSWPIAAVGITLFGGIGLYAIVSRVSRSENRRIIASYQKELEIERLKNPKQIEGTRG